MSAGRKTTQGVLLCISSQLPSNGITVGSLKSAVVEVFTPWEVQTPRISPCSQLLNIYRHTADGGLAGAGRGTASSVLEKGN